DIDREDGLAAAIAAREAQRQTTEATAKAAGPGDPAAAPAAETGEGGAAPPAAISPVVSNVGPTVRISFPFEMDTAAAVFRRGDVVWMLFETRSAINRPSRSDALASIASGIEVIPAGD